MTTYSFQTQLATGHHHENRLDAHFSRWYEIFSATHKQQRNGIDREYMRTLETSDGDYHERFTVEYKADERAGQTHNAFLETVSVDPTGPSTRTALGPIYTGEPGHSATSKPGWVYTSQADYIFYYVPGDDLVYVLKPARLRRAVDAWQRTKTYTEVDVQNQGYVTRGLIVPLAELEKLAEQVISL